MLQIESYTKFAYANRFLAKFLAYFNSAITFKLFLHSFFFLLIFIILGVVGIGQYSL